MPRYIWRDGHWVERVTGERLVSDDQEWKPVTPTIIGDIAPYQSPVTGDVISGRAARRDDLKRHNCVDANELPSPTSGKIRSRRILDKYRLPETMLKEPGE